MKKRISDEEIKELYVKWQTPPNVKAHCKAVSDAGVRIARELNKHGYSLDEELIRVTGMVHDVARTKDKHALVGYQILENMGYDDEAQIVKVHMTYPKYNPVDKLDECDIVCIADRIVKEDKYVGLDERIQYIIDKEPRSEEVKERILQKKQETGELLDELSRIMGMSFDELFAKGI